MLRVAVLILAGGVLSLTGLAHEIAPATAGTEVTIKGSMVCNGACIPPGRFLMGTPFYMWPYFMEEYPHMVTLTKPFYMSEIPITQAMYEAVMGNNPSTAAL